MNRRGGYRGRNNYRSGYRERGYSSYQRRDNGNRGNGNYNNSKQ